MKLWSMEIFNIIPDRCAVVTGFLALFDFRYFFFFFFEFFLFFFILAIFSSFVFFFFFATRSTIRFGQHRTNNSKHVNNCMRCNMANRFELSSQIESQQCQMKTVHRMRRRIRIQYPRDCRLWVID